MKLAKAACLTISLLFTGPATAQQTALVQIVDHSDEELAPYLWGKIEPSQFELSSYGQLSDPLQIFMVAFRGLYDSRRTGSNETLQSALTILDYMLDEYEPAAREAGVTRWYYGDDYQDIKAPWWSGMDALFGPMTLYAAYEVTGELRYRDEAIKSALSALETPESGGVLWKFDAGCWLSEYTWTRMTLADEYHVMNGHLWALQALYLLAEASGEAALQEAYDCAASGTFAMQNRFYRAGGDWTNYQLTPLGINPTHYNILEHSQHRAMRLITGDKRYLAGELARAEVFQKGYPLSLVGEDGTMDVVFSMLGPPHPYWTDTYPVRVSCEVGGRTLEQLNDFVYDMDKPLPERLTITVPVGTTPQECSVSINSPLEVLMYRQTDFSPELLSEPEVIQATPEVMFDAVSVDGASIQISPAHRETDVPHGSNDEARITLPLHAPITNQDLIALVVTTPVDVPNVGIIVQDEEGNAMSRYYRPLIGGQRNLLLLNRLGFEDNDALGEKIASLSLRLFTDEASPEFHLTVDDLRILKSPAAVKSWLESESASHLPQQ